MTSHLRPTLKYRYRTSNTLYMWHTYTLHVPTQAHAYAMQSTVNLKMRLSALYTDYQYIFLQYKDYPCSLNFILTLVPDLSLIILKPMCLMHLRFQNVPYPIYWETTHLLDTLFQAYHSLLYAIRITVHTFTYMTSISHYPITHSCPIVVTTIGHPPVDHLSCHSDCHRYTGGRHCVQVTLPLCRSLLLFWPNVCWLIGKVAWLVLTIYVQSNSCDNMYVLLKVFVCILYLFNTVQLLPNS